MCDVCQISAACRIEYETENDQTWLFSLCKLTNVRNSHIPGACRIECEIECLMLTIFTFKTWKIYDVCHIFIACRIRYETRITTWCCHFSLCKPRNKCTMFVTFLLRTETPKSCSASSNFLKLWRRCIAAVPKFKLEKS